MPREQYQHTKPHLNIGTIGHIDHGKTMLTTALVTVLSNRGFAERREYSDIAKGGVQRAGSEKILTVPATHVEYETDTRHYSHIDCPGHRDYIRNMITGAAQMDGAILVVEAVDGPMPQTREHIILAHQVGVPRIVVFLNKVDLVQDEEILLVIEEELKDILTQYGYPGYETPMVRGSALNARDCGCGKSDCPNCGPILELLRQVDEYIPIPPRDVDKPFLMPVDKLYQVEGRGTVAASKIERGTIKRGDAVHLIGYSDEPLQTVVTDIEIFGKATEHAEAGDDAGVLLRGVKRGVNIKGGQVIAAPGSIYPHARFKAEVYILRPDEGGRHKGILPGFRPQLYIRTADITGTISFPDDVALVLPGDHVSIFVELDSPIAVEKGLRFALREGHQTIGAGVISEILV